MRWSSAPDLLPAALDAVVEGAWLAIAYLALQVLGAHGPILLGPVEFALLAGAGLLLARGRLTRTGASLVVVAAVAAAAGGWIMSPAVREALLAGRVDTALGLHTGGWLAGLAVVRGAMHAERSDDDLIVSRLLAWGVPGLAIPWLLAQVATPAARAAFSEPAFVATLAFVVGGLLAVAVARLDSLGSRSGVGWRSNPTWLLVLGLVAGSALLVALPLAAMLGVPLDAAVRGAIGPVWLVVSGAIVLLAIPAGLLAAALVALLRAVLGPGHAVVTPPAPQAAALPMTLGAAGVNTVFAIATVAVILLVLVLIARRVLVANGARHPPDDEERGIVLPGSSIRPNLALPRWRPRAAAPLPHDAVTAYVAAIDELRRVSRLARAGDETPAAHAHRLRASGLGMLSLELLAADYALVRYAGRTLTRAEDRRALARWRRARVTARAGAAADESAASTAPPPTTAATSRQRR